MQAFYSSFGNKINFAILRRNVSCFTALTRTDMMIIMTRRVVLLLANEGVRNRRSIATRS